MIAFSAVPRRIDGKETWSVLTTTTEATTPGDSVTICARREGTRDLAVSEAIRAAKSVQGAVFITGASAAEVNEVERAGLTFLRSMPTGAAQFLALAARGSK